MPSDSRPIGVFDSGVGGLSVVKHLSQSLPHERFVYLGDTARVPYGNRSKETVQQYARECTKFLLSKNVKLIVVACNTVSAIALDVVKDMVDVPVVDMIMPAARSASENSQGHVGVIGTRATIGSGAYSRALMELNANLNISMKACPLFVPLVEEGWVDTAATRAIADEYLRALSEHDVDTVVLGCTHYPLLADVIQEVLPDVDLIDCGESAAQEVQKLLGDHPGDEPEIPAIDLYVTDQTPAFTNLAQRFLGKPVDDPTVVSLVSPSDTPDRS